MTDATRRSVLVGTAIIGAMDILPYAQAQARALHPDAALIALKVEHDRSLGPSRAAHAAHGRLEEAFCALGPLPTEEKARRKVESGLAEAEEAIDRAGTATFVVIQQIAATPASTLVGLRIKAEISHAENNLVPEFVESIVADLLQMEA